MQMKSPQQTNRLYGPSSANEKCKHGRQTTRPIHLERATRLQTSLVAPLNQLKYIRRQFCPGVLARLKNFVRSSMMARRAIPRLSPRVDRPRVDQGREVAKPAEVKPESGQGKIAVRRHPVPSVGERCPQHQKANTRLPDPRLEESYHSCRGSGTDRSAAFGSPPHGQRC